MKVIVSRPPMFDEIDRVFQVAGKPVIFSWGDRIYNPEQIVITPELMAHEKVHGERQRAMHPDIEIGVVMWWAKYLVDKAFRLEEELPAHRKEYFRFTARHSNPKARRRYLSMVAERLASALYGEMVAPAVAERAILRGYL
jgi:hypothetical protein